MSEKYIVSAECAIRDKDKYLVIKRPIGKHAAGKLSFPGGGCEKVDGEQDDCLQRTVIREVYEEVGLKLIDPLSYICSNMFYD